MLAIGKLGLNKLFSRQIRCKASIHTIRSDEARYSAWHVWITEVSSKSESCCPYVAVYLADLKYIERLEIGENLTVQFEGKAC